MKREMRTRANLINKISAGHRDLDYLSHMHEKNKRNTKIETEINWSNVLERAKLRKIT